MGIADKFKDLIGLNDDDFEDDESVENVESTFDEIKQEKSQSAKQSAKQYVSVEKPIVKKKSRGESIMTSDLGGQMQFILVKPERFEDTPQISDHLLEGKTVVLNLESTSKEISRRIVDFLTGVSYAISGHIKKVALGTYIIVPHNAEISGDIVDEIENTGVFY